MHVDGWTLALQTVNFAVLVWLLQRFLYRPVLRLLDARRAQEAHQIEAAEQARTQAQRELSEATAQRAAIESERRTVLQAAAAQAEEMAAARQTQAERDAEALLANTRKALAEERTQVLMQAHQTAFELGVTIAQRLYDELPAELRAEALLTQIVQYVSALPDAQRQELIGADKSPALHVITAQTLCETEQADWRERIQQAVGGEPAVTFAVDAALIAGAELHFAHAITHFSWRHALEAMRQQEPPHDDAH